MPKQSPKRQAAADNWARPHPTYHNRQRIKRIAIGVAVLAVIVCLVTWNIVTTFPDVRAGDTVRVKYQVLTADGMLIEGSDDLTVHVDVARSPRVLYYQMTCAKIGVARSFAVAACPTGNCTDFEGYTTGSHAWQAIRGTVTVLAILNR